MEAARNRLLLNIWQSLQIETRTTITMLVEGLDLVEIADSHQPIVDAIASGDAELAARVAREHQDYFERLPVPGQGRPALEPSDGRRRPSMRSMTAADLAAPVSGGEGRGGKGGASTIAVAQIGDTRGESVPLPVCPGRRWRAAG